MFADGGKRYDVSCLEDDEFDELVRCFFFFSPSIVD